MAILNKSARLALADADGWHARPLQAKVFGTGRSVMMMLNPRQSGNFPGHLDSCQVVLLTSKPVAKLQVQVVNAFIPNLRHLIP